MNNNKFIIIFVSALIFVTLSDFVFSESIGYDECNNDIGYSYPGPEGGNSYCSHEDCCCCFQRYHVHDLGSVFPPANIEIEYRPGLYQGCTSPMYVYYSTDGSSWSQFYSTTVTQETWSPKTTYNTICPWKFSLHKNRNSTM